MKVKDAFAIKESYPTEHEPGLVVVLDTLLQTDPHQLVDRRVVVSSPSGDCLELVIDEAKDHGPVNSLFFRHRVCDDIPIGSEVALQHEVESPSLLPS